MTRPALTVEVVQHDGPPIDLETWCANLVAHAMELERRRAGKATVGETHPRPKERAS